MVKPQSAFFEACGPDGMAVLQRLLRKARGLGLLTILDAKRNDIASTAAAYADAAFGGVSLAGRVHPVWEADALTVNPYLGRDAVEPFLQSARRANAGVFVLVRTSNPGAGLFQDLIADGRPVYQHVAEAVAAWAAENVGRCGLGDVGAVVGATYPAELAALRHLTPDVIFLIPGYGARAAARRTWRRPFGRTAWGRSSTVRGGFCFRSSRMTRHGSGASRRRRWRRSLPWVRCRIAKRGSHRRLPPLAPTGPGRPAPAAF